MSFTIKVNLRKMRKILSHVLCSAQKYSYYSIFNPRHLFVPHFFFSSKKRSQDLPNSILNASLRFNLSIKFKIFCFVKRKHPPCHWPLLKVLYFDSTLFLNSEKHILPTSWCFQRNTCVLNSNKAVTSRFSSEFLLDFFFNSTMSLFYRSEENRIGLQYAFNLALLLLILLLQIFLVVYFNLFSSKRGINNTYLKSIKCDAPKTNDFNSSFEAGQRIEGFAEYTAADVAAHADRNKSVWVTYREGVYDITDFIDKHPGGADKIILAAGKSVEPYWNLYSQHKHEQIFKFLEEFRIGNLKKSSEDKKIIEENDPYRQESIKLVRNPALQVITEKPYNAETPLSLLIDNFITPNELFFVRNHLPTPILKPLSDSYRLEVGGLGVKNSHRLTVEDIKTKFEKHSVIVTIQCAGNRRNEFKAFKEVKGLDWKGGAIGTAKWTGARLRDVLEFCGIREEHIKNLGIKHIHFEGLDKDLLSNAYGASIPIDKAIHPDSDVIIAYEMNDEELPVDHGYPLRIIVPGVVGARNVKWLSKITLSESEIDSFWQKHDYRVFSPSVDWTAVDWKKAPAIQECPVQSCICQPLNNTALPFDQEELVVKGYAWSGGGRGIIRVEVSVDDGKTWNTAKFLNVETKKSPLGGNTAGVAAEQEEFKEIESWSQENLSKAWHWVIWSLEIPIPSEIKKKNLKILSRAVDGSYNTQPESVGSIWNLRGCLCNAWSSVIVNFEEEEK